MRGTAGPGQTAPPTDRRRPPLNAAARAGAYVDLALQFAVAILLGAFGGWWLDGRLGSRPLLMLAGTLAGAVVGFYSLYRGLMARRRPPDAPGDRPEP